ncbi:MAG: tRNA uridine-5-carboxymethylaminomethyl(34) synthesis GTPase MnmE, partial [Gammaproteobacteria bacterium]|nr:tRNA uridine-5-carboxymethylaminomethyl(34) synthesis GTPase MnmE [Gammaproteobacteria bacterium]
MATTGETIAAIATPPGVGGVGIVRVSGQDITALCKAILERLPAPRQASFSRFRDAQGEVIDEGIALFFPAPNSFTGEEVIE